MSPDAPFSGFIFKIQANMDPRHRDRIAFLRVVSGQFQKDMEVTHIRTGRKLRLTRPQRVFAQERETVEEAFPGDIIGLTNPGAFRLGDTLSVNTIPNYDEVPPFQPETFASIRNLDVSRLKHFDKGIRQLSDEGLIDLFYDRHSRRSEPILGAVGRLQFEVVQHRLMSEYGVKTALEPLHFEHIRWITGNESDIEQHSLQGAKLVEDGMGHLAILVPSDWTLRWLQERNPKVAFVGR